MYNLFIFIFPFLLLTILSAKLTFRNLGQIDKSNDLTKSNQINRDNENRILVSGDGWIEITQKNMLGNSEEEKDNFNAFMNARYAVVFAQKEDHTYKDMRKGFRQKGPTGTNFRFLMRMMNIDYPDEIDEVEVILQKKTGETEINVVSLRISKEQFKA